LNLGADLYFNKIGDPETVYGELVHGIRQTVEKSRAEEALKASEAKYRCFFEDAKDPVITFDLTGNVTAINKAVEEYGFQKNEIIGQNMRKFVSKRYWSQLIQDVAQLARGKTVEDTIEIDTPKGKKVVEYSSSPITVKGNVLGIHTILKDVTEHKQAEEELIRLFTAVKMSRDGIVISNLDGNIVEVNDAILKMYGSYDREELLGKNSFDLIAPEEREKAVAGMKKTREQGYTEGREYHVVAKDGSRLPVELSAAIINDADGKPLGFLGIIRDITDRKIAEDKLQASEEKYRLQFEEAMDAIFMADAETGVIIDCNREACVLVGRTRSELVGAHQRILHPPEKAGGAFSTTFQQHLRDKDGYVLETQVITKQGAVKEVAVKANVFDLEGRKLVQGVFRDITERKNAVAGLQQSERDWVTYFNAMDDVMMIVNVDYTIEHINDSGLRLLGKTREDVIGAKCYRVVHGLNAPGEFCSLKRSLKTKKIETVDRYEKAFDRYFSIKSAPIFNERGAIVRFVSLLSDTTERKKGEESLLRKTRQQEVLLSSIPAFIYYKDTDSRFLAANKAFSDLVGTPLDQIPGKTSYDFFPQDEAEQIHEVDREVMASGKPTMNLEVPYTNRSGETGWASTSKVPYFDEKGDVTGMVGITTDITERKRMEEELQAREELLRNIIESSEDMVSVKDLDGRFIYWSSAPQYGFKPEEVIGKTYSDLENPATAAQKMTENRRVASTGKSLTVENYVNLNGQNYWFSTLKYPIRNASGEIVAIGTIERNITKRKQMDEKLRVIGGLTRHDVRNKLTSIAGNIYLIKRNLDHQNKVLEHVREIEDVIKQTERIFDFAKAYEQLGVEDLVYVDVEEAIDAPVSLFSDMRGVEVVNDCGGLSVLADSSLRPLFYTLIDNSLKHGERVTKIRVYYDVGDDAVNLIYEDDGVGVPHAEKEKIFLEGYGKGTGYGLFLIKKMCDVYGWAIRETGQPGEGARFIITISTMNRDAKRASYQLLP
jgi:PAS domain S-box-containing protein